MPRENFAASLFGPAREGKTIRRPPVEPQNTDLSQFHYIGLYVHAHQSFKRDEQARHQPTVATVYTKDVTVYANHV